MTGTRRPGAAVDHALEHNDGGNSSRVTRGGLEGARPGREALPGAGRPTGQPRAARRRRRKGRGREELSSYYGLPVINRPVWEAREIAGYLYLGGLAGASSVLGAGAQMTRRPTLERGSKAVAAGAAGLSLVALIKDLGRPERFLNMLRVFKPTSPMNIGSWLLSGFVPATLAAAASELTGIATQIGVLASGVAAVLGPAVASYTAVLISDTAVPAWHEARREMPVLFVASAGSAAAGAGLLCASERDAGPARRLALATVAADLAVESRLERRLEPEVAAAYRETKAHRLLQSARVLSIAGAAGALIAALARPGSVASRATRAGTSRVPRSGTRRGLQAASGAALMAASACTRFGVFQAGMASAADPAATIGPQRRRISASD